MQWVWLVFLFVLGACVGSFLNVVIHRLPRGRSIVFPGSHCPSCGRAIRWYDNIPLLSWFLLRARCRDCGVRIASRYVIIEGATALLVSGLYAWYFLLGARQGAGAFFDSWPAYVAHAALLCGLLACSVVDIEMWLIPLEVTWFCSAVALAAWGVQGPHPFMPAVSPDLIGASAATIVGLAISLVLLHFGYITPSFMDATDKPITAPEPEPRHAPDDPRKRSRKLQKLRKGGKPPPDRDTPSPPEAPTVAITVAHGVNPRREILRELVFLIPPLALGFGFLGFMAWAPGPAGAVRDWLGGPDRSVAAAHLAAAGSALFGYLVGAAWVWGTRIGGTLAFGKEAMGMGDVHILACVGAAAGWMVPSITFFVAPFLALLWAVAVLAGRRQRELPYGPWLAIAALLVLLFRDGIVALLRAYISGTGLE